MLFGSQLAAPVVRSLIVPKGHQLAEHFDPQTSEPNPVAAPVALTNSQEKLEENMLELMEHPVRQKRSVTEEVETNQLPAPLQRDLVQLFKLLSDETRLRILMYLYCEGELHVTAMCERLQQSQPAVSHHLALLRESELIGCRRDGKHNFYSLLQNHFHRVVAQLFKTIADPAQSEFRFDEFVLTPRRSSDA